MCVCVCVCAWADIGVCMYDYKITLSELTKSSEH